MRVIHVRNSRDSWNICNAENCEAPATTTLSFSHSSMCNYCGGEMDLCDEHLQKARQDILAGPT